MSQHSFGDYIKKIGVGAILLVAVLLTPAVSQAAVLTWDPAKDGLGNGGTGNWDVTTVPAVCNWIDPTNVPWTADVAWTAGNDAFFGGTGGAVTVDAAGVSVVGITFDAAGYSLYGGNISANNIHFASTVGSTSTLDMYGTTSIATTPASNYNSDLYIGENGTATVNMHGDNTLSASWDLFIGANTGSSGTLIMDNNSIIQNAHSFWVANQVGSTASITMKGNSKISSYSAPDQDWGHNINFGNGGTATLDMSGTSSVTMNGDYIHIGTNGSCTVTMTGQSSMSNWNSAPWVPFSIGTNASGLGSITMGSITDTPTSHTQITSPGDFRVGEFGTGTTDDSGNLIQPGGYLNMSGYAAISAGGQWGWNTWFDIAREVGSTGKVIMSGHSSITQHGDFNVGNNGTGSLDISENASVTASGDVTIGRQGGTGTITQTGGTVTAGGWLHMAESAGNTATYDISGGNLTTGWGWIGEAGNAILNIHGTAAVSLSRVQLGGWPGWGGAPQDGNATITISDTASLTIRNDGITSADAGTKAINLNGGTLNTRYIGGWGGGPTTLNLNGGLLQSNGNDGGFIGWNITANVLNTGGAGGAYIDTNSFDCTVLVALLDGDGLNGGLTKTGGTGTLTLNGINTYTGLTTVKAGTLNIAGSIVGKSQVNANATLLLSGGGSVGDVITVNGAGAKFVQTSSVPVAPVVTLTSGTVDGTSTITTVNVADLAANVVTNGNGGTGALTITNLTFLGKATMNLNSASQFVPALNTTTLVTSGKQVTINASADSWVGGLNDLISYSAPPNYNPGGNPDFVLGAVTGLSPRQMVVMPTMDYSLAGIIALNVTGYNPTWTGLVKNLDGTGNWTRTVIPNPKNWALNDSPPKLIPTTTDFWAGDIVTFDDSALMAGGTTDVVISDADVAPMKVIFNNTGSVYTISSAPSTTWGIVDYGAVHTTMIIKGGGVVTLASTNTYSGGTTITQGTLNINNASAIGIGALTIDNSTTSGALITIDNTSLGGAIALTTNNAQKWNSDFTFTGSHSLDMGIGTVTLGASPTVTVTANTLTVGVIAPAGHALTKTGAGTLTWVGTTPTTGATTATSLSSLTVYGTMNQSAGVATVFGPTTIGDATATGTYNLSGGTFVKNAAASGQMMIIGNGSSDVSTMNISNAAVLDIQNEEFAIGDLASGAVGIGLVKMTNHSQITVSGTAYNTNFYVGGHNGGIGTLEMHDDASITTHRGSFSVGGSWGWYQSANEGNGTITMYDRASINTSGELWIGMGPGGSGDITLYNSANITTGGNLNMSDTAGDSGYSHVTLNNSSWIKVNGEVWIGQTNGTDHVMNVNDTSTITSESWFCVGRNGATGVLNVKGGTVKKEGGVSNENIILGSLGGTGTVNLESGSILNDELLILGENMGSAYFHLDGGLVQATAVTIYGTGASVSNLYYNGGTLQATADSTDFVNALVTQLVQTKGAVIDSNTHAITINTSFIEDTDFPGGGLTKIGEGTVILGGFNYYNGNTTVTNGILQAAITASLPNYGIAGKVKVSTGATIAVNVGGINAGGASDWLALEVNTLDTNAAYSGGSYIGFDTTNATPSFTYSYAVANPLSGGTKGLKKLGTNTLVLDATNTYSGNTIVNNGTLELSSLGQINTASAITTAASATFEVDGTHVVGTIGGTGTTSLLAGSRLTATSVVQGTVTVGAGATLTIAAIPGGPGGMGSISPVPEPATWAMLMLAAMGLGIYWRRSR